MTVSKAYLILGMMLVGGLTVAGFSASNSPAPVAAVAGGGHEGHDHGESGDSAGSATSGEGHGREMATYTFNGIVKAIDAAQSKVTIKHEKIGDYMDAMTMEFDVADPSMLEGLKVGDEKSFILHVNPSMTAIVGVGEPSAPDAATPASATTSDASADHADGHKCAEHKDGQKCAHEGDKGHSCCAKHAKEDKK